MPGLPVQEFVDNDAGYLVWTKQHTDGWVLNVARTKAPSYLVLHRATCPAITRYSKYARPGGFTERDFIKICALEVEDLRDWARRHGRADGSFTAACAVCEPEKARG